MDDAIAAHEGLSVRDYDRVVPCPTCGRAMEPTGRTRRGRVCIWDGVRLGRRAALKTNPVDRKRVRKGERERRRRSDPRVRQNERQRPKGRRERNSAPRE